MREMKLIIHPRSHALSMLRFRLSVADSPEEIVRKLNQNFNAGVYQEGKERVYVAALGYFGIMPSQHYEGRYFCTTFYKGKPPSDVQSNASIEWFVDEF